MNGFSQIYSIPVLRSTSRTFEPIVMIKLTNGLNYSEDNLNRPFSKKTIYI